MTIAGLELAVLILSLMVVFLAALIRGYSGFGFSALAVASLSIMIPPAVVVPAILLVEIFTAASMLPSLWQHIDWRRVRWIGLGAVVATPIGLMLLDNLPSQWMRILISVVILVAAVLIWMGLQIRCGDRRSAILSAGMISGLANGAAGVGGLPLVVFFLASSGSAAAARATLIVFLVLLDIYTCSLAVGQGMINDEVLKLFLAFLPPVALGTYIGNRQFMQRPPENFRRIALSLLMVISCGSLLRSLFTF
ncbi:MAG: sulfite exporter TauE/SafE family protein [Motiliproteus sp.]|nr:sulfite exporter TauE/SafE family protein [Motiliproteus sp.]MCW9051080.1 sulfite exporter TauE/SafE family protein [Motiliproteus sp.]